MFLVAGVGCVRIYSSGIKVRRVKLQMRFLFSSSAALMKFEQVSGSLVRVWISDALREGAAIRQKNMEAVEGRNRRALGDIGNLFTGHGIEGKQQQIPQVSRTVTRGFCAQLVANA
ncbi:cyclin-B1-5-like isoform X2 [Apium graveolens]|uniref:cyclin-B1-5-like isoform X2 n=1 Tax=Apium graveolens TaxID=4045 RepID=UPI003D7AB129